MFADPTQLTELEREIKYLLNATKLWNGSITDQRRSDTAVTYSRKMATLDVQRAIAKNQQHGYWGEIAELVAVNHDSSIPPHEGAIGLPWIMPFSGGNLITGEKCEPGEIDSFRNDPLGIHSRVGGVAVPHNQADANGYASPVSGYYSLVNAHFKFTGLEAYIPMVQLSMEKAETKLPVSLIPTVIKLALMYHIKEGDNLPATAGMIIADGKNDLVQIQAGVTTTNPVADIQTAQKEL